ncbi:MAG: class I SAM-dependent methyltransferase [Sandaracinaceae bacterium]|nr:class I SAM-dependent methyltransferase [Sandaracinaceae bacterium]
MVEVAREEKVEVPHEFDRVAGSYDFLTGMNPGYLKHLAWSASRLSVPPGGRALDLCCGTGLSTAALVEAHPRAEVVALDASAGMLEVARTKKKLKRVRFVHGDAMDPCASGVTGPFDAILMAYGIRNVPDPDLCLDRLFELLAPGGTICFHEYSVKDSAKSRAIWNAVSACVIIPGGFLTAGSSNIYRYLRRSVLDFDGTREFEARLRRHGFVDVHTEPMDGWQKGIVHSFLASRPK